MCVEAVCACSYKLYNIKPPFAPNAQNNAIIWGNFFATTMATAVAVDIMFTSSPYIPPILMNVFPQEWLQGTLLHLEQTSTWIQKWTD